MNELTLALMIACGMITVAVALVWALLSHADKYETMMREDGQDAD